VVAAGFFIAGVFLVVGCFLDAIPAIIIVGTILQALDHRRGSTGGGREALPRYHDQIRKTLLGRGGEVASKGIQHVGQQVGHGLQRRSQSPAQRWGISCARSSVWICRGPP
jgi:hypothetical protein